MSDRINLKVEVRNVFGKRTRALRRQGILPANLFGGDAEPIAISLKENSFAKVYDQVGHTGIIDLEVEGKIIPTMIAQVQRHPLTQKFITVDFKRINLKEKVNAQVPVAFIGVSEAVRVHNAVIIYHTDKLKVEALPQNIPQQIEVDLGRLQNIDDEIKVADLAKNDLYEIVEDQNKLIVSAIAHKEESIEVDTTSSDTEVITEKPAEEA